MFEDVNSEFDRESSSSRARIASLKPFVSKVELWPPDVNAQPRQPVSITTAAGAHQTPDNEQPSNCNPTKKIPIPLIIIPAIIPFRTAFFTVPYKEKTHPSSEKKSSFNLLRPRPPSLTLCLAFLTCLIDMTSVSQRGQSRTMTRARADREDGS